MTETPDTPTEQLAEARMWARHGCELGQINCTWTDHGVAPAWLTEGWPIHFPGPVDDAEPDPVKYPHPDGDVTVLGPEIFASSDGQVICWKGENYVPQGELAPGDLRQQYAAAIWASAEHNIIAEWICCEPLDPKHELCAQGYKAMEMIRALIVDDPEAYKPAPLADAVLNVRDTELRQLQARLAEARTALRIAEGDRDAADEERDRLASVNPPGSTREQLPADVLALLPIRPYLSTACQTAAACEKAADIHCDERPWLHAHAEDLHQRCRLNHKFTGQPCACPCHDQPAARDR